MVRGYNSTNNQTVSNSFRGTFFGMYKLIGYRKAKDYTYLYGKSLDDEDSSLTRHLRDAFVEGCRE